MSTKGQVYFPFGNNLPPGTVNVKFGGTGCTSPEEVVEKLNAITKTSLGTNGGIASLSGTSGKITGNQVNKTAIKSATAYLTSTYEQAYLNIGQTIYFNIEGFDQSITYNITADKGTIERNNGTITYTAPTEAGTATVSFNGKTYTFEVIASELGTPTITSHANNATGVMPAATFTSSVFTIQRQDAPLTSHSMTSWEIATSANFETSNIVKSSYNDTTNKVLWSVTGLPLATLLYIRVRYRNSNGIWSEWSTPICFTTITASVDRPTITSPSNASTVATPTAINLVASAVSITGGTVSTYPHIGTDWQVSTNSTFTNIVKSTVNDTTNKTTWTASGLTKSTTYYVRVRYNVTTLGYSDWSSTVQVTTPNFLTDASGRTFYRHESGMGTVMGWVDKKNVTHQTLVLDATYRNKLTWANTSNYNFDVSGLTNYTSSYYYLSSGTTSSPAANISYQATTAASFYGSSKTDAQINALSSYFEDANTSKSNTNYMMANSNLNSTSYAAGWCRSKTVNGVSCDLPNIQTLTRIYCSMFKLDEMDPTPNGNKRLFTIPRSGCTYNWYFDNSGNAYVWSSTEYNSNYAWRVYSYGYVNWGNKSNVFGVVPVLEL